MFLFRVITYASVININIKVVSPNGTEFLIASDWIDYYSRMESGFWWFTIPNQLEDSIGQWNIVVNFEGNDFISSFIVANAVPYLNINHQIVEIIGDQDGIANPNETLNIISSIDNPELVNNAYDVELMIECDNSLIQIDVFNVMFGDILAGETVENFNSPLSIYIPNEFIIGVLQCMQRVSCLSSNGFILLEV